MKREMAYETMDWEAEAKRIARAFSVKGECYFEPQNKGKGKRRLLAAQRPHFMVTSPFIEGHLVIHYYRAYRDFSVFTRESAWKSDNRRFGVRFSWSGDLLPITSSRNIDSLAFLRGLFCLGLLTTEIEEAIGANVTAHQKLEWALEFEERSKFDSPL